MARKPNTAAKTTPSEGTTDETTVDPKHNQEPAVHLQKKEETALAKLEKNYESATKQHASVVRNLWEEGAQLLLALQKRAANHKVYNTLIESEVLPLAPFMGGNKGNEARSNAIRIYNLDEGARQALYDLFPDVANPRTLWQRYKDATDDAAKFIYLAGKLDPDFDANTLATLVLFDDQKAKIAGLVAAMSKVGVTVDPIDVADAQETCEDFQEALVAWLTSEKAGDYIEVLGNLPEFRNANRGKAKADIVAPTLAQAFPTVRRPEMLASLFKDWPALTLITDVSRRYGMLVEAEKKADIADAARAERGDGEGEGEGDSNSATDHMSIERAVSVSTTAILSALKDTKTPVEDWEKTFKSMFKAIKEAFEEELENWQNAGSDDDDDDETDDDDDETDDDDDDDDDDVEPEPEPEPEPKPRRRRRGGKGK